MSLLERDIRLKADAERKDFWQKVWLIQRYVESLGFQLHDR